MPAPQAAPAPALACAWPYGRVRGLPIRGAANGLRLPSVRLLLALQPAPEATCERAALGLDRLATALGLVIERKADAPPALLLQPLAQLQLWLKLMVTVLTQLDPALDWRIAGTPLLQQRHAQASAADAAWPEAVLFWPTHWPDDLAPVLLGALQGWHDLSHAADDASALVSLPQVQSRWKQLTHAAKVQVPPGFNSARLLAAAYALQHPVFLLDRDLMQIGHGRRGRLWRSTATDATPSVGVSVARDKLRTNRLLHLLGVPVPKHTEVSDAEAAVIAAEQIGWPVVLKPADRDRGYGARANLQHPDQVRAAYTHASSFSQRVLVEQHIAGLEYRLTVVRGKLFWVLERVPAAVTGDGQHTLQQLVDAENALRQQALLTNPNGWVPIPLDGENLSYLQESGHNPAYIPAAGEVVRLQRVPAATTGGKGRAHFDTIHPDNRLLAERAAQLLRLDVAGVDLIMPDITRSWREVGGAVTEVNAIPQIVMQTDPSLMQRLLQELMPQSSRIPLLFVLAATRPAWLDLSLDLLAEAGWRVGVTDEQGLQIGPDWIRGPRRTVWDDVRALQLDPSVAAVVIVSDGASLLQTGLPFDQIDALVLATHQAQALGLLLPYASGLRAVLGIGLQQAYGPLLQSADQPWQVWADSEPALAAHAQVLATTLMAAESGCATGPAQSGIAQG